MHDLFSIQRLASLFIFCIALLLLNSGNNLIAHPNEHTRPPGITERVSAFLEKRGASEVSLRAGQSYRVEPRRLAYANICFDWSAQFGPDSLVVEMQVQDFIKGNTYSPWYEVDARRLCRVGGNYQFTMTSRHDQVIRWGWYRPYYIAQSYGRNEPLCPRCGAMPTFDEVSNPDTVVTRGWRHRILAFILGIPAVVMMIGPTLLLSMAYNLQKTVMPSDRKRAVRNELRSRPTKEKMYDANINEPYRQPEASSFRRRQDIDDLDELITDIKGRLKLAKEELAKQKSQAERDAEAVKAAEAEFEEAVREAKRAQAKMEAAQGRLRRK